MNKPGWPEKRGFYKKKVYARYEFLYSKFFILAFHRRKSIQLQNRWTNGARVKDSDLVARMVKSSIHGELEKQFDPIGSHFTVKPLLSSALGGQYGHIIVIVSHRVSMFHFS